MTKVLIVDDERGMRVLIRLSLRTGEYDVLEAEDADQAWTAIQEHCPAVVVLDVQMPGRTGIELTRTIRSRPGLSDTRILLLSAKAQDEDLEAGRQAGADAYLTKPFSPSQLEAAVAKLLRRQ